jgi:autotransporter-associated beta strand protein
MKPKNPFPSSGLRNSLIALTLSSQFAVAGTNWDGGATPNTNIDAAANWDADTAPGLAGTTGVIFQSANNVATLNVPVAFRMPNTTTPAVAFNANFTLNTTGGNSLTLYGTNSGGNAPVLRANQTPSAVTINAPIRVFSTSPSASPLGGLLIIGVNNTNAANTALNITGGISLASGSSGGTYDIRYVGAASMTTQAKARISGTISGLGTLANVQGGTGIWAGDLIIAGDQASTSTSNITMANSAPNPTTSARLVLGESSADDQVWNNITLNNVMNLAIGGNVSANVFSGNLANTRITGASSTGNLSLNSGTIGANVAIGGAGTHENALSLTKKSSGVLNLNSITTTYTGTTTVEAGTLNISSAASLASPIVVNAAATLEGECTTTSSLTFGTGTSTLNFDSSTAGSMTVGSLVTTGATIIANPSGTTSVGNSYVVLTRSSGTFSAGDVAAFVAGGRATMGGAGTNQITYTPTPISLVWKGNDGTNPTYWDLSTTFNWSSGSADRFFTSDQVTFDDTASSFNVAIQGSSITPGNIVFDHDSPNDYNLSGGTIGGGGSFTKKGSGKLTLTQTGVNTFTGALNLEAGVFSISHVNRIGSATSTRPITLKGGTFQYTGATQTSDSLPFILDSATSTVDVTTLGVTWRSGAATTGSGHLIKTGPGILALGKNGTGSTPNSPVTGNTFTGTIQVNGGTLDVRNPDSLGAFGTGQGTSVADAVLEIFPFGQNQGVTLNPEPLSLSGASFLRSTNQDNDSDVINEWTGPVTVAANAVVGIGSPRFNAGFVSRFIISSAISTGSNSVLNLGYYSAVVPSGLQEVTITGALSGSASVTAQGSAGSVYTLADPEYSGNTTVNSGKLTLGAENASNNASTVSIAATGATLDLAFTGTDTVDKLYIGGIQQAAGVYSSSHASGVFTGTGTLTVSSGPLGFTAWTAANAPNQSLADDHDNDGVDNGIEYFMGLSGSGFTANPGVVGNSVTWTKGASYTGTYGVQFVVQTSTDLSTWFSAPLGTGAGQVDVSGSNVTYTLPSGGGKTFVRLKVNPD